MSVLNNISQSIKIAVSSKANPPLKLVVFKSRIFSARYLRRFMMKNGGFSDAQIMAVLKQAEGGTPVSEVSREHGMSSASFYKWRAKFGGMDASLITETKFSAFGFSIEECRELLGLYQDQDRTSSEVKRIASKRLGEIEEKQRELQSLHDELAHLVTSCRGDHLPDCPIIDYLG